MAPCLAAMAVLVACSAFFSGSEAALFYLRWDERKMLAAGSSSERVAARLLDNPDRLLSAVLLWNLMINMTYFGLSSIVAMRFEQAERHSEAIVFSVSALLTLIFFSEMLPKSVAVLSARRFASLVGMPLAAVVRALDPIMPTLRVISLLSRRLLWPGYEPESYLEVSDLERAIELSTTDTPLIEQERATLRNIVMLSDIRVEEWMRPRTQFVTFPADATLDNLNGEIPPSGYALLTARDSEDIALAVKLSDLTDLTRKQLRHHADPVACVPWCATVADVLQQLQRSHREVAVVVNEFGETIGILTFADILATLFHENPSRSDRLLAREPIQQVREGGWHVTGMTSLRRLARHFDSVLPATTSFTVGGVLQDELQRLAEEGDEVDWGPFHFRVLAAPQHEQLLIEVTQRPPEELPA